MFVIEKKKLYICLAFIIVIVLALEINVTTKPAIKKTSAIPVNNKIIVLDARTSDGEDGGAVAKDGTTEAELNLQITLKLQKLLEKDGNKVILTRTDSNGIYDIGNNTLRKKKISDTKNRVKIGNESNADIFVSIHLNKIPQEKYWGWQTFYKKENEQSKILAQSIQKGLNETIKKNNKRKATKINNIYIIDHVKIPTVIVECGFLSNTEELELLKTEEYQEKIANGIYVGIMNYFTEVGNQKTNF